MRRGATERWGDIALPGWEYILHEGATLLVGAESRGRPDGAVCLKCLRGQQRVRTQEHNAMSRDRSLRIIALAKARMQEIPFLIEISLEKGGLRRQARPTTVQTPGEQTKARKPTAKTISKIIKNYSKRK